MCCEAPEGLLVPPPVADMLARYRQLAAERGWDWGDELGGGNDTWRYGHCMDLAKFNAVMSELRGGGGPVSVTEALLRSLRDPVPPGLAVFRDSGIEIADRLPFALAGRAAPYV